MQIAEENMKENNILPAHHPPSLNIHTVNNAKFHNQAQQGATCSNILHSAVPGWAEVACSLFSLGLIVKSTVCGVKHTNIHFTNLTLCVPTLE